MNKIIVNSKSKWPISFVSGFLVVICYTSLTIISILYYPLPYSPLNNWLSDLGYYRINPGAFYYNLSCMLAGISLIVFFIGLNQIESVNTKITKKLRYIRVLGIFAGISDFLIGIYSEDYPIGHSIWSIAFFLLITIVIIESSILILQKEEIGNILGLYGVIVGIFNFIFFMLVIVNTIIGSIGLPLLTNLAILEWVAIFSSLIYIGFFSREILLLSKS